MEFTTFFNLALLLKLQVKVLGDIQTEEPEVKDETKPAEGGATGTDEKDTDEGLDEEEVDIEELQLESFTPTFPDQTIINAELFCDIFPFHVLFDHNLVVKQCGFKVSFM